MNIQVLHELLKHRQRHISGYLFLHSLNSQQNKKKNLIYGLTRETKADEGFRKDREHLHKQDLHNSSWTARERERRDVIHVHLHTLNATPCQRLDHWCAGMEKIHHPHPGRHARPFGAVIHNTFMWTATQPCEPLRLGPNF